ncbi:MAG: uroporphyrinogen-III C-methyltransferase [Pirellulaceae bacterium]
MNRNLGKVFLVGAGPGDPDLLTLRGAECLRQADVVLYDYLVNPQALRHTRSAAECICLGQHGQSRLWTQEEVHQELVRRARAGQIVVRLKGGDPGVFARGGEELDALDAAQIPYEVVPGVTAALAASSYAGIPLTHREHASAVALVTGQEGPEKDESLDYVALARFPGTLVFYMGVTTARSWSAQLLTAGKPPDTPVAIVRRGSLPDQRVSYCRLDELGEFVERRPKLRPPAVIIVGQVATPRATPSWFERRPLFGRRILVTRPDQPGDRLTALLAGLGADLLCQPAIEIAPPADWRPVDAALSRLAVFHWLVFSSANGVRYLLDRLLTGNRDLRQMGTLKLAAIGTGTAESLRDYRLRADVIPTEFRAESLATSLAGHAAGQRFLLARASRGREVLAEQLTAAGGLVEQVVVYESRDVVAPFPQVARALAVGDVQWVTVTSSAIARSLHRMFGATLSRVRLASISPITSEVLRELGYAPAVEATTYSMDGLAAAIVDAERKSG